MFVCTVSPLRGAPSRNHRRIDSVSCYYTLYCTFDFCWFLLNVFVRIVFSMAVSCLQFGVVSARCACFFRLCARWLDVYVIWVLLAPPAGLSTTTYSDWEFVCVYLCCKFVSFFIKLNDRARALAICHLQIPHITRAVCERQTSSSRRASRRFAFS